jgi:hypothetical protein
MGSPPQYRTAASARPLWNAPRGLAADALPLLAFTMQRMFDLYLKEQRLTVADYDAMGGIEARSTARWPRHRGRRAMLEARTICAAC